MGILDSIYGFSRILPAVKSPERPTTTKEKLIWVSVALIIFFLMYSVTALGVTDQSGGFDFLQTITASRIGSLVTTGIGPIVLASIFLQLFVGAGIIKLNLQDKKDKEKFQGVQKVLAIVLAFAEAAIFVVGARVVVAPLFPGAGEFVDPNTGIPDAPFTSALVILQIAFGSILLMYLDEVISKYGIGSGISIFIAAGVSFSVVGGAFSLIFSQGGAIDALAGGGAEALADALLILLPVFFTILVFLVVVYAEGIKVEIPIAFQRIRGLTPKLPLKFFYVSNIPVIFASALILNVQLFSGGILPKLQPDEAQQALANGDLLPYLGVVDPGTGQLYDGLLYYVTPIFASGGTLQTWILLNSNTAVFAIPEWIHSFAYIAFLAIVSVLFGMFWVETANMDAKSVANQLAESGLQIPGWRRDPRMLEVILNKYIFPLTVLGSFSVGLLAGLADLTGALGTGTGILLTVGILYRMYEQMEQQKMFDLYPGFNKLIGE